ncbi:hypothetical protein LDENG_00061270 [Lucifuga dentata]|nr:hypothetical protein LDENG_00061270 [Lucifuga dentata]
MLSDVYGCVVANRFRNLLDDDADPFDLISEVETEKEKQKNKKKEEEEKNNKQKKRGQKESQKDRRVSIASAGQDRLTIRKQQAGIGPVNNDSGDGTAEAQRSMKRAAFGQHRANQEQHPQKPPLSKTSFNAEPDLRGLGGMRGGRGTRGTRGGGGGYTMNLDNFSLRGKREFERHSGTGISPDEKRGGRGPWNWGSVEDTAGYLMEVTSDSPVTPEEPQSPVQGENQALAEEDGEMVVQVAMEMSLDEWKALQEMSRPKTEFNIRKAESKIPSKAKVIHQSKHLENLTLEDLEKEGNFLRSRVGGGRGPRGGPFGRPERAKSKSEKDHVLAPNPDDPDDFPALSAGR